MLIATIATLIGLIVWFVFLATLRRYAFYDGYNRFIGGVITDQVRARLSEERRAHGDKIYKDFEFFYQSSLAIAGGIIYLLVFAAPSVKPSMRTVLANSGGDLIIAASFLFIFFIANHVYSLIRRFERRYALIEIFHWQETGAVVFMIFLPVYFRFALIPVLLSG